MLRSLWTAARLARVSAWRAPLSAPQVHRPARSPNNQRRLHSSESPAISKQLVQLRPYQEECVQSVLDAFAEGRRRVGISLATGGGKTVIFTELIGRAPPPSPQATRTLILVHRRELVEQALRHCCARYPNARVEMELGRVHASGCADITVASVQSLISRDRIAKFDPRRFKLVLVDEAHHIVADSYLKVLDHFGLLSDDRPATPALVGVSATFLRHDGLALGKAIKHIVFHKDYVDMIGEKWLSDVVFTTVRSGADLSRVRRSASGDFSTSSLSAAVNRAETNELTVRAWRARAQGRQSTLVFCVDIAHLTALAATFRKYGVDARVVTAQTHAVERSATVDAFREGQFPVLLNCGVFTEGTDVPCVDCVLLARPTRSRGLLVQMIGRGMRRHPGKKDCHVLDMVGSLEHGIVTVPSLFGLDPSELVNGESPDEMRQRTPREAPDGETEQPILPPASLGGDMRVQYTDYASVADLIADTSGERHIRALSQHAWVCVSTSKFVLTNGPRGSHLVIERMDDSDSEATAPVDSPYSNYEQSASGEPAPEKPTWHVKHLVPNPSEPNPRGARSPFLRPRTIAQATSLAAAVRAADTFSAEHFTRAFIVARGLQAAWREAEATAAQRAFLERVLGRERVPAGEALTKGKAADMIVKIKHGARGAYRSGTAQVRRRERREERGAKMRIGGLGEHDVGVGPLPVS